MLITILATCCLMAPAVVDRQDLFVKVDPIAHRITGSSHMHVIEGGDLRYSLHPGAVIEEVMVDGITLPPSRPGLLEDLPDNASVVMRWRGRHVEDVEAGEVEGAIHNLSVRAHAAQDGVFLSSGSSWHPQPLDERGVPQLRMMSLEIEPIEGWSLIASGDPSIEQDPLEAVWNWRTPRPVSGMSLAGNRHGRTTRNVDTAHGQVMVVLQVSDSNLDKSGHYLDAAERYLTTYCRLLGPYPFERFTIVENFFSSGFAFPGFTLLGPRVIAMAPRSLKPGYLDHELVHAWWGNGVYVDPTDGNWCEALTSFCTNYGRRWLEEGPDAARSYRRGIINQVSLDPDLDDGPLGDFGRGGLRVNRFVGYQKGSFVIMMLQDVLDDDVSPARFEDSRIWDMMRSLAKTHMGERIDWRVIQDAAEATRPDRPEGWLDPFFDRWVRKHTRPRTTPTMTACSPQRLERIRSDDGSMVLVDPECRHYRLIDTAFTSPTIAGTLADGTTVVGDGDGMASPEEIGWTTRLEPGANMLLIGREAIDSHAEVIARTANPIVVDDDGFSIGRSIWNGDSQSVLHTMHHPDLPGRYITVFHSNGEIGWRRLRLAWYYRKDTTVVWDGEMTRDRSVFEPDAWMRTTNVPLQKSNGRTLNR
ncbi:MAG: hypothetical protein CMJ33_10935 [Phycisphaerae bacterium]|nr:hypothetical protein [Phycisphaerae bacterium]